MTTRTRAQAQAAPPPSPAVATQQVQQQQAAIPPGGSGGGGGPPGGGGGGGPPGGGDTGGQVPRQVNQPPQFALTPALINNDPLDFTQVQAIKLFYRATQALENQYDLSTDGLKLFLESLRQRSIESNWWMTLTINRNNVAYNLIDHYGVLSYQDVRDRAMMYHGQHTRDAQNSMQIFTCLSNTLTQEAKARVYVESDKYTIGDSADGLLFLKVIVQLSHIDTNATITMIRTRLSSLDVKMSELQDDIIQFNEFVKTQVSGLNARGQQTEDLLVNLFKGYKAVADSKFVQYIEMKEDAYNEGHLLDPQVLMELAQAKYKTMLEQGDWKTPTEADKRIVALTAQLEKLQKEKKPGVKKGKKDENKKTDKSGKKDKSDKPKWWLVEPKPNEPKVITKGKKEYHWCPNHEEKGKWVRHKPSECNAKKPQVKDNAPPAKDNKLVTSNMREADSDNDEY